MCPYLPYSNHVTLWVEVEASFFFKKIFLFAKFKELSFWKKIPNLFTRRVKLSSSSDRSSYNSSLESTFEEIILDLFSWASCFSSLPSPISSSWSFLNNVTNAIFCRLFFSDIAVTFFCQTLVKDLRILRLSSSLEKVWPSTIKWFVKCVNLFCKSRINSSGYILNNSYFWDNMFNFDLFTSAIPSWVTSNIS